MVAKSRVKFIKGKTPIEKMTAEEIGYLAGVLDGCGTFTLNRNDEPEVTIEKKSDLGKKIALEFGGFLRYHAPDNRHKYYRFNWYLKGEVLKRLLTRIKPLLRSNKRQREAELLVNAFGTEDEKIPSQIRRDLDKKRLDKALEESAKKDGQWFDSL